MVILPGILGNLSFYEISRDAEWANQCVAFDHKYSRGVLLEYILVFYWSYASMGCKLSISEYARPLVLEVILISWSTMSLIGLEKYKLISCTSKFRILLKNLTQYL